MANILRVSQFNSATLVRIGFVPLVDCAPLVVAYENGWFAEKGIQVKLVREAGWASIRDKIVCDELDAAHAIAGLCFAIPWGLSVLKRECLTGFLFNSNGNSIVLGENLLNENTQQLAAVDRSLKFAIPHIFSSHHFLLKQWLKPLRAVEGKDYEVVTVSPLLMVEALRGGFIDGFCVGEPYGSLAVTNKVGKVVKESATLSPLHPEKALLVTKRFASQQEEVHLEIIACLIRAAKFCDSQKGRREAARLLSKPSYLDLPQKLIEQSLLSPSEIMKNEDFHIFNEGQVNNPSPEKASWIINHMRSNNLIPEEMIKNDFRMNTIFRSDIYQDAKNRLS